MGDRILVQVIDSKQGTFSPVAYGHWCGRETPEIVARLAKRMAERPHDQDYTFARLIQEMVGDAAGATSFGCWNASAVLTASDSHGDAGVLLIDVAFQPFHYQTLGGYLRTNKAGTAVHAVAF